MIDCGETKIDRAVCYARTESDIRPRTESDIRPRTKHLGLRTESEAKGRTESVVCSLTTLSNTRTTDRVRGLQSESESVDLQTAPKKD
ncbi:hypothetical protein LXL04_031171 [Taraxacum kok-saghyz]